MQLQVRDQLFEVNKSILENHEDSALSALLSERWKQKELI